MKPFSVGLPHRDLPLEENPEGWTYLTGFKGLDAWMLKHRAHTTYRIDVNAECVKYDQARRYRAGVRSLIAQYFPNLLGVNFGYTPTHFLWSLDPSWLLNKNIAMVFKVVHSVNEWEAFKNRLEKLCSRSVGTKTQLCK